MENVYVVPHETPELDTSRGLPNTTVDGSSEFEDILAHTNAASVKEAEVYQCLLKYLKTIKKQRQKFLCLMCNIFGENRLRDASFQYFLATQLCINYQNFKRSVTLWFNAGREEKRGRWTLSPEVRQSIYDTWIQSSIPTTDNRNSRATIQISKHIYFQRYNDIENKTICIEKKKNKRGRVNITANRMIVTDTVSSIQKSLVAKGINVCSGSILNLKPFFVTYATEKELSLCMCKICLNAKILFEPLMARAKKDGDEVFDGFSSFLMANCDCDKSENGYYKWSCSTQLCRICKSAEPPSLKCETSDEVVTVDQFEQVEREYNKLNETTGGCGN